MSLFKIQYPCNLCELAAYIQNTFCLEHLWMATSLHF